MPSTPPATLGIDLGTSSCKAVIVDVAGRLLAHAAAEYPVVSPMPGRAETDPAAWWDAVGQCVRQATRLAGADPSAIGLSGQMHGLVLCDATAKPVRPALLWADNRAVSVLDRFRELGAEQRDRLANPITPGMAGPLLAWVADNEPEAYGAARWALQPKDWLRARLTGQVAAEPSDGSATLLYDILSDGWDGELMAALGLRRRLLPPLLRDPASPAGTLTPGAAAHLGLTAGIPVAAGAGDTAAAALGSGIVDPVQVQLTVGTGAQVVRPLRSPVSRADVGVHLYRSALPAGWYHMAASANAGITLNWVRATLGASWEELYASLGEPIRPDDPLFIPHLTGERTPYLNPRLRGSWTVISLGHDRKALLRSALEGVAFAIAEAYDALVGAQPPQAGGRSADAAPSKLRVAGGGTLDAAWRQLLSTVVGAPLYAVGNAVASGRGAALLGAYAAGLVTASDITGRLAPAVTLAAEPQAGRQPIHAERRRRFHERVLLLGGDDNDPYSPLRGNARGLPVGGSPE